MKIVRSSVWVHDIHDLDPAEERFPGHSLVVPSSRRLSEVLNIEIQ
jgi:hypothetical protein